MRNHRGLSVCVAALTASWSAGAMAQDDTQSLMAMGVSELRQEIQTRHDAGLSASTNPAIVSANDTRFLWSNEAKVQCGIALGFLKSSTKDEVSIGKCVLASRMMNRTGTPPTQVATPPRPADPACAKDVKRLIFFEFDSAELPASAEQTVQFVSQNTGSCRWTSIAVTGHTDRAGSNAYNDALARRRAQAVASYLSSGGVNPAIITVDARGENQPLEQTEDGVRNPQNRRVEIIAN